MRFPFIQDKMRIRPRNCVRVLMCAIALHNFLLNTGAGYNNVDVPETVDDNVENNDLDDEYDENFES